MGILKCFAVLAQEASPAIVNGVGASEAGSVSVGHASPGFNIGVFEFVIVIVFLSFLLKVVTLHYASRAEKHANQAASPPKVHTAAPNPLWQFAFVGGCVFLGFVGLAMAFFLLGQPRMVIQNRPQTRQSNLLEAMPEAPQGFANNIGPVSPHARHIVNAENGNQDQPILEQSEIPDDFLADRYPSIADCGAPLAIKTYDEIVARWSGSPAASKDGSGKTVGADSDQAADEVLAGPITILMCNAGLSDQDYLPLVAAFTQKLEAKIKQVTVKDMPNVITDSIPLADSNFHVLVASNSSYVGCTLRGKDSMKKDFVKNLDVKYDEKLWVTDLDAYAAKYPGPIYIVGRSDDFFASEKVATERAVEAITDSTVESHAREIYEKRFMKNGRIFQIADLYHQKYKRPYGDVFRCAVLLQSHNIIARNVTRGNTGAQKSLGLSPFNRGWTPSFEWFIALLIGLTVVVGIISNVLTQGYYRTEISRAVVICVVGGFLILVSIVLMIVGSAH